MRHNLAGDTNKIGQDAGIWPCVEEKKNKWKGGSCDKFGLETTLISSWMKPKLSVHSCAHQSLGKRSCHLTARHRQTTLCIYSRHVEEPLASLPMKLEAHRFFPFWFPRSIHIKYLRTDGATTSIVIECGATQSRP